MGRARMIDTRGRTARERGKIKQIGNPIENRKSNKSVIGNPQAPAASHPIIATLRVLPQ